ncbi:hypothetical protein EVAR_15077_1 [Eumeta japonica]|uniref:Uncharacterized protein n=1 Tax=Eumeta variegata TaxID=151549 RepID=A0A4C1YIA8_EUMVA|nr:hypothetical protein EVAR_15077_1 [Eumeta japonica]
MTKNTSFRHSTQHPSPAVPATVSFRHLNAIARVTMTPVTCTFLQNGKRDTQLHDPVSPRPAARDRSNLQIEFLRGAARRRALNK